MKNSPQIAQIPPIKKERTLYKQPSYDVYWVADELQDLLGYLAAHPEVKTKVQLFKGKKYSKGRFYRYKDKYPENKRVNELHEKIDEILEARLIEEGLRAKNFPFIIFLLKNNYGYQDKREVEATNTHVFKVSRGLPTPVRKPINVTVGKPK